ncbi:hypothetical protein AB3T32_005720 [Klebsiella variicola]|uniref:hypothetical protein n=1 Tax=Klebsiella quasipneumoniae TaxID=1463165 RepID=UPI0022CDDC35|nr:hypothetical protein [Klebsiella quasipneumoniae]MCZ9597038.1 hypothetical protein [Klebsiella quasipneumoniae]
MVSKYAVLNEGVVENIIVADDNYSPDDLEVVKYSDETFASLACCTIKRMVYFMMINNHQR